jgi:hypothetical protein
MAHDMHSVTTGIAGCVMEKNTGVRLAIAIADMPCAPHTMNRPSSVKWPVSAVSGQKWRSPAGRRASVTQLAARSTMEPNTSRRNAYTTGFSVAFLSTADVNTE